MRELAIETLLDPLTLVAYLLVSSIATAAGVRAEMTGLSRLVSHPDALAIWYVYVGVLALYAGLYLVGYREIAPRVLTG